PLRAGTDPPYNPSITSPLKVFPLWSQILPVPLPHKGRPCPWTVSPWDDFLMCPQRNDIKFPRCYLPPLKLQVQTIHSIFVPAYNLITIRQNLIPFLQHLPLRELLHFGRT